MNAQKERARNARGTQFSMGLQSADLLAFTEKSEFTYEEKPLVGTVIGLFKDGVKVNELTEDGEVILIRQISMLNLVVKYLILV